MINTQGKLVFNKLQYLLINAEKDAVLVMSRELGDGSKKFQASSLVHQF
jgi:hypothetical protein